MFLEPILNAFQDFFYACKTAQLNLFIHFYVCTHIGMEFEYEKKGERIAHEDE